MFEFLRQPGFFGTHATMGADLSQLMATLFTGLFIVGWVQAWSAERFAGNDESGTLLAVVIGVVALALRPLLPF